MTSADSPARPLRALRAVTGILWPAGTGRDTRNAVAALASGTLSTVLLGGLTFLWGAAVAALLDWPVGGGSVDVALYVAAVVLLPAVLLLCVPMLTALQRSRLHGTLGLDLSLPAGPGAQRRPLLARQWRTAATWRQLGFHWLAVVTGVLGGGLVVTCWLAVPTALAYLAAGQPTAGAGTAAVIGAVALLLAAPRLARAVRQADVAAGRALLGPSRSEELAARVATLARSRADLVAAADAERRRIERDLHDGAQQRLVALAMNLGMARARLDGATDPAAQAIEQAHDEAVQALTELREFIRGLHPAVLSDRGLDAALSGLAARSPLPVRLRVDVPRRASPSIEAVAYFIVSEALTNVTRHAQAAGAEVTVTRAGDVLRVTVTDDGRGGAAIGAGEGTGLAGLAQRAAAVDGTLTIDSPPGGPTVIGVELPCES
jgi:signal transduction histidine kinase